MKCLIGVFLGLLWHMGEAKTNSLPGSQAPVSDQKTKPSVSLSLKGILLEKGLGRKFSGAARAGR